MTEGSETESQGSEKSPGFVPGNSTNAASKATLNSATMKPKESKKDRHMKLVYELSKFLEKANEATVQEVLLLKRTTRETLETVDDNLQKFCATIDVNSYLLDKSERQLISKLNELKSMIKKRADVVTQLEADLDQTEVKRAKVVGDELKALVDKLIAIGYNLPDDIERFVENEAFDMNKDIISNRIEHAKTIADMRVKHVQLEHELIEKWESTRRKWRQLRHEQALEVYTKDINSDYYNHPEDRNQFMEGYRRDQGKRRKNLEAVINKITNFSYESITSEVVTDVQQLFQRCNEDELNAIQNCYNSLTELRKNTDYLCRERVEELRKELHVYGALKIDPKFGPLAKRLEEALADPNLAELWRLGGGLKPDTQTLVNEMTCDDIVYDRVIVSMKEKLDFIQSGFPLKGVLEEKGRLASLDKIRGMVTKLRSAPRSEIAGVMKSLLAELEELNRFEGQLSPLFMTTIQSTSQEMKDELEALDKRIAAVANIAPGLDSTANLTGTLKTMKSATKTLQTAATTAMIASTLGKTKSKKGNDLKEGTNAVVCYVDPMLLKNWQRKLAILFYSSDLPTVTQELCAFINLQVTEQKECNRLVDEVIDQYSTKLLQRMDRVYKKMVDRITSYLETSANFMFVQTTNLGNFFLKLAKIVELHKSTQKSLDDKAADELWDISEDSRLLLEDLEDLYKQTCRKIRESTKQDEIDEHFQEILNILEKIQQEYRNFHQKSCFAADKYPLSLIDEYRSCLMTVSHNMFVFPTPHHPIVTEYDRLFDSTERFNRSFFEGNPSAAGIDRRSYAQQQEGYQVSSTIDEHYFESPHGVDRPSDEIGAYGGRYQIVDDQKKIYEHFYTEGKFKIKKENGEHDSDEEAPADANKAGEGGSKKESDIDFDAVVVDKPAFEAHQQCCFFKADATILPVNEDEYEAMHADDREEYELALLKAFVRFPEGTPYDPNFVPDKKGAKAPPPPDNTGTILGMTTEDQQRYHFLENVAKIARQRIRTQASMEYIREHPPCDQNNQPWANPTEVTFEEIEKMYESIRQKLITSLETESFRKLLTVEKEMKRRKDEFTDQLEDRIRNHWPRRGRVETEIKQPREAELLGHKDKTWRLIQLIQQKMIDLQRRYEEVMQQGIHSCEQYIQEIVGLRNQCNGDFKNLAALQAIDVKARGITLDFQSDCQVKVTTLDKYASVDIESIIIFAKDFRKICPKQSPENESGYSESELQEIQLLIDQQCEEMTEVTKMWKERNSQLSDQQTQTLKTYDDFIAKYNKCVQEVAMAEGLGQKYGAPRRRAQERIRTEISKDERRAGKVDEFLAELEFFASEVGYLPINDSISDGISVHSLAHGHGHNNKTEDASSTTGHSPESKNHHHVKFNPTANNIVESCANLNQLYYTWTILKALREALIQRVKFLEVINNDPSIPGGGGGFPAPISLPDYPWLNESRVIDVFLKDLQTSPFTLQKPVSIADENLLPGGQVINFPTVEAAFLDVDKVCREETKQLYESEGLASILGPSGVPASLNDWLHESKEKVLGRHGYRERAWKKLWSQLDRLDGIFIRIRNISEQGRDDFMASSTAVVAEKSEVHGHGSTHHGTIHHSESAKVSSTAKKGSSVAANGGTLASTSTKKVSFGSPTHHLTDSATSMIKKVTMSIQGACIQSYLHSFVLLVKKEWFDQKQYFLKLLHVWQLSREKHERLLRPRLGSPDKADELEELNQMELTRSLEMISGVNKFRTSLIRSQMNAFRNFVEDISGVSKGLLMMLDTIMRQELLLIPPDTEIPKKHMTLKKLRKAQRIREEVAKGGSDKSQRRVWPGIEFSEDMIHTIRSSEDMVIDLGQDPKDLTGSDEAPPPVVAAPADAKKGAKDKKPDKNAPAPAPTPTTPPSLIPTPWMRKIKDSSSVEGLVSSAHRIILEERANALAKYLQYLHTFFHDVREEYSTILKQEQSWIERWKRQVDMLKQGKV